MEGSPGWNYRSRVLPYDLFRVVCFGLSLAIMEYAYLLWRRLSWCGYLRPPPGGDVLWLECQECAEQPLSPGLPEELGDSPIIIIPDCYIHLC